MASHFTRPGQRPQEESDTFLNPPGVTWGQWLLARTERSAPPLQLPEERQVELQARQVPPGSTQIQNRPARLSSCHCLPASRRCRREWPGRPAQGTLSPPTQGASGCRACPRCTPASPRGVCREAVGSPRPSPPKPPQMPPARQLPEVRHGSGQGRVPASPFRPGRPGLRRAQTASLARARPPWGHQAGSRGPHWVWGEGGSAQAACRQRCPKRLPWLPAGPRPTAPGTQLIQRPP